MHHSLQEGVESLVAAMSDYEAKFGERFHPAEGWSLVTE
jgi:hypothetical protein